MPYVEPARRTEVIVGDLPETPGELNFAICALADTYVCKESSEQGGLSYTLLRGVWADMAHAAAEFKRRVLDPYEDRQLEKNGEVFLCLAEGDHE